jgi:CBS domain-containing protein
MTDANAFKIDYKTLAATLHKHPGHLLSFDDKITVAEALRLLSKRNYRSAPVMGAGKAGVLGFVDSRDLLVGLLAKLSDGKLSEDFGQWKAVFQTKECAEASKAYLSQPVAKLVNKSHVDKLSKFSSTSSLSDIVTEMAALRLHRVAITDDNGVLVDVLTASDIVNYIASEHLKVFDGTTAKAVMMNEPICMEESRPTVEAYQIMQRNQVSGIAITKEGRLVANLSATDLSFAMSRAAAIVPESLFLPVQFLVEQSRTHAARAPVAVRAETTMVDVVKRMAQHRVHRVWVINGDDKPIGVITPTEVLKFIAK